MEGEKDAASGKLGKKTPRVSLQLQQLSRPNVQPVSLADTTTKRVIGWNNPLWWYKDTLNDTSKKVDTHSPMEMEMWRAEARELIRSAPMNMPSYQQFYIPLNWRDRWYRNKFSCLMKVVVDCAKNEMDELKLKREWDGEAREKYRFELWESKLIGTIEMGTDVGCIVGERLGFQRTLLMDEVSFTSKTCVHSFMNLPIVTL
jgi:hypothetical protein